MPAALRVCAFALLLSFLVLPAGTPRSAAESALVSGWEPAGDLKMIAGGNASFFVNCTSPGCSTLVFQWFQDDALVAGETGARFTFTAMTNLSGAVRISVLVTDGSFSARNAWNVTVELPILLLPEGPVAMAEGSERTFRVMGTGNRSVSWFLDGADLGRNGTEFVFGPDFLSAGTHLVAVSVAGAPVRTWTVTVTDVNRPPALPQGRPVQGVAGETISVKVNASDPDGRPLHYEWDLDSDGTAEVVSNQSGDLAHRFTRSGEYRSTLTVTDEGGASASTVYLFDIRERAAPSAWLLPAALAIAAVLVLAIVVGVQARRLSKMSESRARAGFFRERPSPKTEIGPPPEAGTPPAAGDQDGEPETLQVRSQLPAKRAELEVSPGHHDADIPLSSKPTLSGPPGVPAPEGRESAGAPGGALKDKGAESESGAQETEIGRHRPAAKK